MAPYAAEAVNILKSLPEMVDVRLLLQDRSTCLKHFFMQNNKKAPCILIAHIKSIFWKSIHNHNRSIEKRLGKLNTIIVEKVQDKPTQLSCSAAPINSCLNVECSWLFFCTSCFLSPLTSSGFFDGILASSSQEH